MKLNNTSQYAIRILTYIVQNGAENKYSAKDISEKLNIPYKYLTKIMTQLTEKDIIISTRGRDGGCSIAKKPSEIKIIDILKAVNENLHQKECILGSGPCDERKKCVLHDKWSLPKKEIISMFSDTTLEDVI